MKLQRLLGELTKDMRTSGLKFSFHICCYMYDNLLLFICYMYDNLLLSTGLTDYVNPILAICISQLFLYLDFN